MSTTQPDRAHRQRPSSVLVLPSPLLGPTAYAGLAAALTRLGLPARVATTPPSPRSAAAVLEAWRDQVGPEDVLVPHSNAGLLAPHLAPHAVATVFVDAALPPRVGAHRMAPGPMLDGLRAMTGQDGMLPPWTRWWPREQTEQILPGDSFDLVDSGCTGMPLRYFEDELTSRSWAGCPELHQPREHPGVHRGRRRRHTRRDRASCTPARPRSLTPVICRARLIARYARSCAIRIDEGQQ
ncbi:hypothetical protein [Serinicoccus kebangsaanensis]|uniref:hypothetical protein n=1 Tax=Serinicoccus kebangsaanensis TaxID=2602069 RepID=UPI00124C711E|nr:hypothetical protein [Serinicoccus kebangsaanensis]